MTLEQYQKEAARTCPDLGSLQLNLIHMVLGIRTEIREYLQATDSINQMEELADGVGWYVANALRFFDEPYRLITATPLYLEELFILEGKNLNSNLDKIEFITDELLDICKKNLAYNKPYSESKVIDYLLTILYYGYQESKSLKIARPIKYAKIDNFHYGLITNIAKLRKRFPDRFNKDLAINRDHDAERVILEGGKVSATFEMIDLDRKCTNIKCNCKTCGKSAKVDLYSERIINQKPEDFDQVNSDFKKKKL